MTKESHIKSTFKNALIYSGASILTKLVGFVMLPVYASYLRGEGYGILGMIDVTFQALAILIGSGISISMRRLYFLKDAEDSKKIFVSTNVILMFLIVIFITVPAMFFNEEIARLSFGKNGMGYYITIALYTFIFEAVSSNALNYIVIKQRSILYTTVVLFRVFLELFLNIYLIVYMKMGILGYLYSQLITSFTFAFIMHAYVFACVGFHFNRQDTVEIMKFSIPLMPGYIATFFRLNTGRIMLVSYIGLTQVGVFEMLQKFVSLLGVLISEPFLRSWDVKRFEICDNPDAPSIMARVFTLQLAILIFFGLILALEIPLLLKILTPKEFWLGGAIVLIAIGGRILLDSYFQVFFGLLYGNLTFQISIIQFFAAVFTVLFNFLLAKKYGLFGVITATALVNASLCIMGFFMGNKYYRIPYEWGKLVAMTVLGIFLFFIINEISFSSQGISSLLVASLGKPLTNAFQLLYLDRIKDGKLMFYVLNNIPLFIEAVTKLIASCSYIIVLFFLGLLPKDALRRFIPIGRKNPA